MYLSYLLTYHHPSLFSFNCNIYSMVKSHVSLPLMLVWLTLCLSLSIIHLREDQKALVFLATSEEYGPVLKESDSELTPLPAACTSAREQTSSLPLR